MLTFRFLILFRVPTRAGLQPTKHIRFLILFRTTALWSVSFSAPVSSGPPTWILSLLWLVSSHTRPSTANNNRPALLNQCVPFKLGVNNASVWQGWHKISEFKANSTTDEAFQEHRWHHFNFSSFLHAHNTKKHTEGKEHNRHHLPLPLPYLYLFYFWLSNQRRGLCQHYISMDGSTGCTPDWNNF